MKRSHVVVLAKLATGLSLLALVAGSSEWKHLFGIVGSARITYIMGAFLLLFCIYVVGVIRWRVLLGAFAARPPLFLLGKLSLIGLFFNTFVPGGLAGDIVRGYHLGSRGVRRSDALASVFTDRFVGLIGLLVVALIGFGTGHREMMTASLLSLFLALALGLAGATVLFYSRRVGRLIGRLTDRFSISVKPLKNLLDAIRSYRMCGCEVACTLTLSVAGHLLMIISVYVLAQSIYVVLPFQYFLAFVPVIGILSTLPISFNGLGLREAGYILLFTQVGLSQEQALGISLLHSGMMLVLGSIGGAVLLFQTLVAPSARQPLPMTESPAPDTFTGSPGAMS